jgi:hypothetical protein
MYAAAAAAAAANVAVIAAGEACCNVCCHARQWYNAAARAQNSHLSSPTLVSNNDTVHDSII